jgi:hydroxymethylbilane synthase
VVAVNKLVIGSRGSKLALWQANHIADSLRAGRPGLEVRLEIIKTKGDKILDVSLSKVGGKGLFTKELEEALLRREVDLAVHSLKDLPTELPEGLAAGVITRREYGADALLTRDKVSLADLPLGAVIGTSSLRRKVQIAAMRPDLKFKDLRGNVDTRIRKLEEGEYDAIVLAQAGLVRLGLDGKITELLNPTRVIPAAGQGALALEYRADDTRTIELISFLDDRKTRQEVTAERQFLGRLGGGCQVPIGAKAEVRDDGSLWLLGMVSDLEGRNIMRSSIQGDPDGTCGIELADRLLAGGARQIVDQIYGEL